MSYRRHDASAVRIATAAYVAAASTENDIDSDVMSSMLHGTSGAGSNPPKGNLVSPSPSPQTRSSVNILDENRAVDESQSLLDMTSKVELGLPEITSTERYGCFRYIYLFILFLVFTSNILDRYMLVFLYNVPTEGLTPEEARRQSMKVDLNITATQYGVLTGPAFMVTLAICALISGQLSKSVSRKWTIAVGLLLWSACIGVLYFAEKYWHVLVSRMVLGAVEGIAPPLSYAMIADYFEKHQRAAANGFFASGIYVGYGLATLTLVAFSHFGWRDTCAYISGIGGILFFILVVFVKEPVSDAIPVPSPSKSAVKNTEKEALLSDYDKNEGSIAETEVTPTIVETTSSPENLTGIAYFCHLISTILQPTDMKVLLLAASLRMVGGVTLGAYLPAYIKKTFPTQKDEFAMLNPIVVIAGGTLSTVFGGRLASYLSQASGKKKVAQFARNLASLIGYNAGNGNRSSVGINAQNNSPQVSDEMLGDLPVVEDHTPYAMVSAFSCILSTPLFAVVFWYNDLYVAMGALLAAYIFSETWFAPIFALLQNVEEIPQYARLMSFALVTTMTSLFSAFAPVILGVFDDKYDNQQMELTCGVLIPNFLAGVLFLFVAYAQNKRTTARIQKAFIRT